MAEIEIGHKVRKKYSIGGTPGLVVAKRQINLEHDSYLFLYYGYYDILVLYPDNECIWERIKYMIRIPYKRRKKSESKEGNRQTTFSIP